MAEKRKPGRPSKYTPELADEICRRLANGEPLCTICDSAEMPDRDTVMRWVLRDDEFHGKYARAREAQADVYADEIIALANNSREGIKTEETVDEEGKSTSKIVRADMVERTRLQIDARKWFASKVAPKKYGDRQAIELSGSVDIVSAIAAGKKRAGECS
jgi:hypothetical protein